MFSQSTFLHALGELRDLSDGARGVKVAVIDGPVDCSHPSLTSSNIRWLLQQRGVEASGPAIDHGTHIVSIIAGSEMVGGIAPACEILLAPVFHDAGSDSPKISQKDLAHAISLAIEAGADVINISAGRLGSESELEFYLRNALDLAAQRDILIVAAAGNNGCDCHHIPALCPTVLAVGSIDNTGTPADYSNWGEAYGTNGILVPGSMILGAVADGQIGRRSGTSQAAAVMSGIAATAIGISRAKDKPWRSEALRDVLVRTALPCVRPASEDRRCLAGIVNIEAILAELRGREETLSLGNHTGDSSRGEDIMLDSETGVDTSHSTPHQPDITPQSTPESCSCGCGGKPTADRCSCTSASHGPQKIFALGTLWFDFETEARQDNMAIFMSKHRGSDGRSYRVGDPADIVRFLTDHLEYVQGITLTLNQDSTPIYALQPSGPFSETAYKKLLHAFRTSENISLVSIPGFITGSTRLSNGMIVPVLAPDSRGIAHWDIESLVTSSDSESRSGSDGPDDAPALPQAPQSPLLEFLERVYFQLRNLGVTSEERAVNYAATNAYQARRVFDDAVSRGLVLDRIAVRKSPLCRPDAECWDVEIRTFDPENDRKAGRVYRYTVDVSDVLPVQVGEFRAWQERL